MSENPKKPAFKRWWFWVVVIVIVIAIASSGGEKETPTSQEQNTENVASKGNTQSEAEQPEQEGSQEGPEESTEAQTVENTETTDTSKTAETTNEETYVNTAKEVELFAGEFIVGENVVPGRYDITSLDGVGNFVVYDGEMPIVNEILTNQAGGQIGVTKIQIDLYEGNRIQISGINKVLLKPAEIALKTTLVSGNHLVGRDVPAGTYIVTAPQGTGNFIVYDGDFPVVNEILGSGDIGVEKIRISIKDGQMIVISGLEKVELQNE